MAVRENTKMSDVCGFVLTKADGTIIIGNTEIKKLTEELLKEIAEKS